jgi:hypothetical protein
MYLIASKERELKESASKIKMTFKTNIFSSVFDAFPNKIVEWWITDKCATETETRRFLFCTKDKKLTDITKISEKALWLLESCHTFTFRLRQNTSILDDYLSGHHALERNTEDAKKTFWDHGYHDIFTDYQSDFEDALDVALTSPLHSFTEKAFILIDPIAQ